MFYGTFFSNGSWRSVWNIEFRDEEQLLELKGKLQVFLISCVCVYIFFINKRSAVYIYLLYAFCFYEIQTAFIFIELI